LISDNYLEFIRNKSAEFHIRVQFKKGSKSMNRYFVLLKTDPTRTPSVIQKLRTFPERPFNGVRLYYTMNTFGTWDLAIWFEAQSHSSVIDFVQSKIAPIPGVLKTHTVPTTPIKEYVNWK